MGLLDTPDQRQSHADIGEKADLLILACGDSNRLAILEAQWHNPLINQSARSGPLNEKHNLDGGR